MFGCVPEGLGHHNMEKWSGGGILRGMGGITPRGCTSTHWKRLLHVMQFADAAPMHTFVLDVDNITAISAIKRRMHENILISRSGGDIGWGTDPSGARTHSGSSC